VTTLTLKKYGARHLKIVPSCGDVSSKEIYKIIREGTDINFIGCDPYEQYLTALHGIQVNHNNHKPYDWNMQGDINLNNRIIRAGGFINYIEQLEKRL
jgi:hypothetical protein